MPSIFTVGPMAIATTHKSYHNRKKVGNHNEEGQQNKETFNNIVYTQHSFFTRLLFQWLLS